MRFGFPAKKNTQIPVFCSFLHELCYVREVRLTNLEVAFLIRYAGSCALVEGCSFLIAPIAFPPCNTFELEVYYWYGQEGILTKFTKH